MSDDKEPSSAQEGPTVPSGGTGKFMLPPAGVVIVEDPPDPPSKQRPDISARLDRIILRLLAKHPDDRYGSATALLEELDEIRDAARGTASFGVESTAGVSTGRRAAGMRRVWIWTAAVAIVLAVAYLVAIVGG